ncbi:hypothetical protein MA20_35190 [Bradyrhizobium japonicum]|uniref:Uncharacterized protein n=1 Tax=Bradyrhizobium japonicum TaxID=375 RepID=A0A0A3XMY7_BRAJP|nr:hypothetical protein [Bradyrhizobium japonicum]KGT74629.1 hypothetical protein MA20_35190 [Bradyrhizobium japonicum]
MTSVLDAKTLRKEAAEARQMADAISNQQDKDFWLGIAEGWLELAQAWRSGGAPRSTKLKEDSAIGSLCLGT